MLCVKKHVYKHLCSVEKKKIKEKKKDLRGWLYTIYTVYILYTILCVSRYLGADSAALKSNRLQALECLWWGKVTHQCSLKHGWELVNAVGFPPASPGSEIPQFLHGFDYFLISKEVIVITVFSALHRHCRGKKKAFLRLELRLRNWLHGWTLFTSSVEDWILKDIINKWKLNTTELNVLQQCSLKNTLVVIFCICSWFLYTGMFCYMVVYLVVLCLFAALISTNWWGCFFNQQVLWVLWGCSAALYPSTDFKEEQ